MCGLNDVCVVHFQFCNKKSAVALVTGGASGLGRATVERFARAGSKVVLGDLPTSKGADVAKELGDNVIFVPVDVSLSLILSCKFVNRL